MAPKKKQHAQTTKQKGKAAKIRKSITKKTIAKGKKGASSSSIQDPSVTPLVGIPFMLDRQFINDEAHARFKRMVISKSGDPVDLGPIIVDYFRRSTQAEIPSLFFANMIIALCLGTGVPKLQNDWVVEPKHALQINSLKEEGANEEEANSDEGESPLATKQQVDQLVARMDSMEELMKQMQTDIAYILWCLQSSL